MTQYKKLSLMDLLNITDPASGRRKKIDLLNIKANKKEFKKLNLKKVDPLKCLERLTVDNQS